MTKSAELKGTNFTLSVLHLMEEDLQQAQSMLNERKKLAPVFFENAPIVVDVSRLTDKIDFAAIQKMVNDTGMIMVAVTGCKTQVLREKAKKAGIAIMSSSKEKIPTDPVYLPTKVVVTPIRSGQQIYAKNADLVVLNHISAGAEIIADGNIHIYGSLRGRAIAGANGQKNAHIFCHNLQPELVSIAGTYWLNEAIPEQFLGSSAKVTLDDDVLQIEPLAI